MPSISCPNCKRSFSARIPIHNCMRLPRHDRTTPKAALYLLHIWGDIEPRVLGPYATEQTRLRAAKTVRRADPGMKDIFMLDCATKPSVEAYSGSDLE